MKQLFASCWQFWQSHSCRFFIPWVAYLCALLGLLLEPRTVAGVGFLPHTGWLWLLGVLLITPWLFLHAVPEKPLPYLRWAIVAGVFLPFAPSMTMSLGAVLCTLAGVLAWNMRPLFQRVASRYLEIAGVWLVVTLMQGFYNLVAARMEDIPLLAYVVAPFTALIGRTILAPGGQFGVEYEGVYYPILLSPDKLGGAFPWMLAGALMFLGSVYRIPMRALGVAVALIYAAALAYFLWIINSWIVYDARRNWWDETLLAGFFAPAAILSIGAFRGCSAVSREAPVRPCAIVLSLIGAVVTVWGWMWVDPGIPKEGTILIDEYYSDWEWSDVPLDTRLYGVQTVYNYYCMAEFLKDYFERVDRNYAPLTYDTLKRYSVLVLKTPTKPYDTEAIRAIQRYIAEGGGVWLIGDHTNIFGMNTYLNSVLAFCGVAYRSDAAIDPEANRQLYLPNRLAHPVVKDLPLFLFYTGCSIGTRFNLRGYDVIMMPRTLRDSPDFSQNTFFGDFAPSLSEAVLPTLQAYAGYVGGGRIVCWADSTLFSNFAITLPGKMELAVASIDFLNRRNWLPQLREVLLGIGILLLGLGVWCGYPRVGQLSLFLWLGGLIGGVAMAYFYEWFYPTPQPHTPLNTIAFLEELRSEHLPLTAPTDEEPTTSYLTAFVAALRTGKYARVCTDLKQISNYRVIVVVHGHQVSDWRALKQLVEQGATLILIDGGACPETLEQVSTLFGLRFQRTPLAEPIRIGGSDLTIATAGYFLNGNSVLSDAQGQVLFTRIDWGRGRVYLSATENAFCDASLGEVSDVPTVEQLALLQLLFQVYRAASEPSTLEVDAGVTTFPTNPPAGNRWVKP